MLYCKNQDIYIHILNYSRKSDYAFNVLKISINFTIILCFNRRICFDVNVLYTTLPAIIHVCFNHLGKDSQYEHKFFFQCHKFKILMLVIQIYIQTQIQKIGKGGSRLNIFFFFCLNFAKLFFQQKGIIQPLELFNTT